MAGTIEGGRKAAATNIKRQGEDWYRKIGARGGANGRGPGYRGGFAAGDEGKERARTQGAIGGRISRRTKKDVANDWSSTAEQSRRKLSERTDAGSLEAA